MSKITNDFDQKRTYKELGPREQRRILKETLIQHQRSRKGARWLSLWARNKHGINIPVATVKHWLKMDATGTVSREGVPETRPRKIQFYKALSLPEREHVYQTVINHNPNLEGTALQQWVRETCWVEISEPTLSRWFTGVSRPRQLFWPAKGHNSPEDQQAIRKIYQQVRTGEREQFPVGFWSGPGGRKRAADLLLYLVEECLGWSYEDTVLCLTQQVIATERLYGALLLYGSLAKFIWAAYPNRESLAEIQQRRAMRTFFANPQRIFERATALLQQWGVSEIELQTYWPLLQQACEWLATLRQVCLQTSTIAKLFLVILRVKQTKYAERYQQILTASGHRDKDIYKFQKMLVLERVIQDNPTGKRRKFVVQAQQCLNAVKLPDNVRSRALEVLPQIAASTATQSIKKPSILAGIAVKVAYRHMGEDVPTIQVAKLVGASYLPTAIMSSVLNI
ncbi:MAG: hypothetical protein ACE5I5_18305 [Candidatus Heimdallarchaeota archaeon]